MRLCQIAADRWPQLEAAYYQINLLRVSTHRFANLVYSWAIERVEPGKLEQWTSDLHDLLPWQDATSEAAVNMESESFMSMMAKGGG